MRTTNSPTRQHIRWRLLFQPTLRQAWPRAKPEAAICVQDVDVQCVLQFTLISADGYALHRRTSRVIHRLQLYSSPVPQRDAGRWMHASVLHSSVQSIVHLYGRLPVASRRSPAPVNTPHKVRDEIFRGSVRKLSHPRPSPGQVELTQLATTRQPFSQPVSPLKPVFLAPTH